MSRPNLYRIPDWYAFFSAHDYAKNNNMSIRKARRVLRKLVREGELQFFNRRR